MDFDVVIVGGSYAGMSAALQVARARRRVLVIDGGKRRNRFATSSHGFLTQDGRSPADIASDARAQVEAYPNLTWVDAQADNAWCTERGFRVQAGEAVFDCASLVLAMGVSDSLPDIPGLAERWGISVFHCPYCHGYELDSGRLGVLATGPVAMHHAVLIPEWGQTTLFTNGTFELTAEDRAELAARGVTIEAGLVAEITGAQADVRLHDGRTIALDGLFTAARTGPSSPLAEQLGCEFEDGPLGSYVKTDARKATTVPGIFACGDVARPAGSVALAVGDGAMAGAAAHQFLVFGA